MEGASDDQETSNEVLALGGEESNHPPGIVYLENG